MPLPPSQPPQDDGSGPQDRGAPRPGDTTPPVTDDIAWRARALKAEEAAERLAAELDEIKAALDAARRQLAATEHKAAIHRELQSAGAIDLDATTLLVERALADAPTPDVPAVVAQLRAAKPVLFSSDRAAPAGRHSSMSGAVEGVDHAGTLAARARETGDRRLLMTYLRARRAR